tara:strand:- start:1023 stop:1625 length:603 start_codon:yes stop_codon:yes gene_type:complete
MTNIPISNGQYKVGTAEQIAIAAGEQNPVADNNGREGWLFIKAAADSAKFNYHLYSDGTMPIILGNLTHLYSNISLETLVANSSKPWITIYTKPQGFGDAGPPTFPYHSKIDYHMPTNFNCQLGEMITIHTHRQTIDENFGYRKCWLSNRQVAGDALDTEEIWYIVIQSDSGSAINTQILVSQFGFITRNKIERHINLVG